VGIEETMKAKLKAAFAPSTLVIVNDSSRHAGHAGDDGSGESHFSLEIVSEAFAGKSRVARHRMVNEVLAEELAGRIHALAVKTHAPGEVESARPAP
jgi:BolA protein